MDGKKGKVKRDEHWVCPKCGNTVLPCIFWDNVKCTFRRSPAHHPMSKCFACVEYKRFMVEMDEADREEGEFVEWVYNNPEAYSRGEVPP